MTALNDFLGDPPRINTGVTRDFLRHKEGAPVFPPAIVTQAALYWGVLSRQKGVGVKRPTYLSSLL